MKRKICSVLLTLCMVLTLLPTVALAEGPTYDDTKGHWAEESIDRWSGHGIVQGSNGSFDPNGSLTRGQMAVILCRLLNLPAAPSAGFTDVDRDAWYADAIDRCAAAGIMLGSGGRAMPNEPISREQSIVMLCRALNIEPVENPDLSRYADADRISDYAKGYVAAMIEAGIINGVTDDSVAPQDEINRASTVTILDRAIIVYADEPGQTVEANGGIVIVAADNVTVTGTAGSIIVAAPEGNVTLDDVTAETVTVTSEGGSVTLNNSTVGSVNVNAEDTTVATTGTTTVDTVNVGESAEGTTVSAGKGTTVSEVANSAEGTTVTGAGKVESVGSDTDVTVETKGTEVENTGDSSIAVTDKNGKESNVTSGESSTTTNTTTSSGGGSSSGSSHSHSYTVQMATDAFKATGATCTAKATYYYSCSCGAKGTTTFESGDYVAHTFGEDGNALKCTVCDAYNTAKYAAVIGENGYETLKDAVDSVHELTGDARTAGTTITLLKDASGAGIAAGYASIGTDKDGKPITVGTNPVKIIIDLNTHTYSLTNPGIGSSGTSTNGFQLCSGDITIQNGKIDVAENSETIKILIMNYANLTLNNVTLDGTNLNANANVGNYTVSNVCGAVTIKDSKIIGKEGGWAFDVDYKSNPYSEGTQITVTNSEITGNIEIPTRAQVEGCPSSLTINSGKLNGNIVVQPNGTAAPNITIKGGSFSDINTALKYTADNATVTILKSMSENITTVPKGDNVTIKAAEGVVLTGKVGGSYWNKSTTFDGLKFSGSDSLGISLNANADNISYTIQNCTFEGVTANGVKLGVISVNGKPANVTVTNNKIKDVQNYTGPNGSNSQDESDGIWIWPTSGTTNVTVSENIIENVAGTGIYVNAIGTISITGNTVSGWGGGGRDSDSGRAIRTDNGSSVTITGNKLMAPTATHEQYIKSTNCTSLNVSGNYWGGNNPTTEGIYSGIDGATLTDYYSDDAMQVLMPIGGLPSTGDPTNVPAALEGQSAVD